MFRLVLLVVCLVILPSRSLLAADGSLDPSFGTGGKLTFQNFNAQTVIRLPDDKLLVGGGGSGFSLARLHPDGTLDTAFGVGGVVRTTDDMEAGIGELVPLPDGKVIAVGYRHFDPPLRHQMHLIRYNADGTIDTTYGVAGKATANFVGGSTAGDGALLPDGRLHVSGTVTNSAGDTYNMALARFNADGSPDATFGIGGQAVTDFPDIGEAATDIVLEADGQFYVIGYAAIESTVVDYAVQFIVVHHNADGSVDTTWGDGGRVMTTFQTEYPYELPTEALLQPDDKLVVAGDAAALFAVARYNPDGSLDPSFGSGGTVLVERFPVISGVAMARQPDGRLVIAGTNYRATEDVFTPRGFGLMRLDADGSVDTTFAPCPQVSTSIGDSEEVTDVLVQPDGKIVVLGELDAARFGTAGTPACQSASTARLKIRNSMDPDGDLLKWKWKGSPVASGDFGDPTADTGYTFCVLDQTSTSPRLRIGSPLMQFDWSAAPGGYSFKTSSDNDFPFTKAKLQSVASGKGKIQLTAKGEYLHAYLPLTTPVTLRLVRDDAAQCWEATFSNAVKNTSERFSAKTP